MRNRPDLRAAWKEANAGVHDAQERLDAAWQAFATGKGGPPDSGLLEQVERLQLQCDQRLMALLSERHVVDKDSAEQPDA